MGKCDTCQKPTTGVLTKDPLDGSLVYLPNICSRCLLALSNEINGHDDVTAKGFICRKCKSRVWALRNTECGDCYMEACEAVDKLPTVDPIEPPLGYHILGASEADAKAEVNLAYDHTPSYEDVEN